MLCACTQPHELHSIYMHKPARSRESQVEFRVVTLRYAPRCDSSSSKSFHSPLTNAPRTPNAFSCRATSASVFSTFARFGCCSVCVRVCLRVQSAERECVCVRVRRVCTSSSEFFCVFRTRVRLSFFVFGSLQSQH